MKSLTILCPSLLLASALAPASGLLTIGDPAPTLSHARWLKGQPVKNFEKGKIYVVEFWATWCEPCKENIPNLTVLAKKYAGRLSISGIDIWESTDRQDTGYMKRVAAFVKKEGDKMAYNVGADDLAADTANRWMKAAGEDGIPMSFVVGKDGRIAWMGHAHGLDEVLAKVTAGTFDVQAAKEQRTTDVEAIRPVKDAMASKQFLKALVLIDQVVAKLPNMSRYYAYDRYTALVHIDLEKTKEMTARLIKESGGDIGVYQMMSSVYATQADLTQSAYAVGMSIIQEALAKKDREYMFLSMAGAVSMFQHDRAKAIVYDRQAVDAAQKDSHAPAPFIEFLKRNLATVESSKTF